MIPLRPPTGWPAATPSLGPRGDAAPTRATPPDTAAAFPVRPEPARERFSFGDAGGLAAAMGAAALGSAAPAPTFGQRSSTGSPLFARSRALPPREASVSDARLAAALAPLPAGTTAVPADVAPAPQQPLPPRGGPALPQVDASGAPGEAEALGALQRFWRDFGIDPLAMARRAWVDEKPADGTPIPGATPAPAPVLDALRGELHEVVSRLAARDERGLSPEGLAAFKGDLRDTFARYGVTIDFRQGAPTVAWGAIPRLEVMDLGGTAAAHELVHVLQCAIGGAAALATAARDKIRAVRGREPLGESEIVAAVATLSDTERKDAFARVVEPMETHAYALFEEGAFHATGMFGKKARDVAYYARGLRDNIDAYCDAYTLAAAPVMEEGRDAKIYGNIAHLARTHGETALVLGGTGVAYSQLASLALALNPVVGAAALLPLAYLSWRTLAG